MLQDIQIFNCPIGTPASGTYYGTWTSVGNLAGFSVYFTGLEGSVWIEASNDPNAAVDGVEAIAAPAAPTLSAFEYGALTNQGSPSIAVSYIIQGGGETVASAATALAVANGYQLMVNSPVLDPLGVAVGYNVYASNGGLYYLQNMPNSSDRFGSSHNGPIPLGRPFIMYDGFQNTGVVPTVTALLGGPAVGENIVPTGNMIGSASAGEVQVNVTGTTGSISPSALNYGMIRVGKSGANAAITQAWLAGRLMG